MEFGEGFDVGEVHEVALSLEVLVLVLNLLLGEDVMVVSVPHVEHEEFVEGQFDSSEFVVDAGLFEVQEASENAQRNTPAQFLLIKRADSFTIHSISITYLSHTLSVFGGKEFFDDKLEAIVANIFPLIFLLLLYQFYFSVSDFTSNRFWRGHFALSSFAAP